MDGRLVGYVLVVLPSLLFERVTSVIFDFGPC